MWWGSGAWQDMNKMKRKDSGSHRPQHSAWSCVDENRTPQRSRAHSKGKVRASETLLIQTLSRWSLDIQPGLAGPWGHSRRKEGWLSGTQHLSLAASHPTPTPSTCPRSPVKTSSPPIAVVRDGSGLAHNLATDAGALGPRGRRETERQRWHVKNNPQNFSRLMRNVHLPNQELAELSKGEAQRCAPNHIAVELLKAGGKDRPQKPQERSDGKANNGLLLRRPRGRKAAGWPGHVLEVVSVSEKFNSWQKEKEKKTALREWRRAEGSLKLLKMETVYW